MIDDLRRIYAESYLLPVMLFCFTHQPDKIQCIRHSHCMQRQIDTQYSTVSLSDLLPWARGPWRVAWPAYSGADDAAIGAGGGACSSPTAPGSSEAWSEMSTGVGGGAADAAPCPTAEAAIARSAFVEGLVDWLID